MSTVTVQNLSYCYQDGAELRVILSNLNYSFETGCLYSLLGNSGSGKTTFLSLLSALDLPREGVIFYEGKSIQEWGMNELRRNHVGIVFQAYNLIPYLTAVENIVLAMAITDNRLPDKPKEVALNLLNYLGIDGAKAARRVTTLSGGEQQRVAIARALATNVNVILADEPTGNLDEATSEDIVSIFQSLAHEHGKCIIMATHDKEIAQYSDVVLTLNRGRLSEAPSKQDFAALAEERLSSHE
jgi:putative ABC transport system ATP-binding protein